MNREFMIGEIKKHTNNKGVPYTQCYTTQGLVSLERAPNRNIYGMYMSICISGRGKKKTVSNIDKQLVFSF